MVSSIYDEAIETQEKNKLFKVTKLLSNGLEIQIQIFFL